VKRWTECECGQASRRRRHPLPTCSLPPPPTADVLLPAKPYPTTPDAPDPCMDALLLHALNHVAKCADLVKRNNERLKAGGAAAAAAAPRDQVRV